MKCTTVIRNFMGGLGFFVVVLFCFLIPTKSLSCSDFRSWQAESVDSGCSNCTQTSPPYPEPFCGDSLAGHMFATQAGQYSSGKLQPPPVKVMREGTEYGKCHHAWCTLRMLLLLVELKSRLIWREKK